MNAPFTDITPPESLLRQPEAGGRFAVAAVHDRLYLAELIHDAALSCDRCRILGYSREQQRWDTLAAEERFGTAQASAVAAHASVDCLRLRVPGSGHEALHVRFRSPLGTWLMRSTADGGMEPIANAGGLIEQGFDLTRLVELDGRWLGLVHDSDSPGGSIREYIPEHDQWRAIDLPEIEAGERPVVSELAAFAGSVYAATVDGERGFALWRRAGAGDAAAWESVLTRGAWRYAHNREALASAHHGDALYLITGTDPRARSPSSKFSDYQGFEIIRIGADGTWDLLVGVPRFSPGGLRIPLSGLGPGMHPTLRREPYGCWSQGEHLFLCLHGVQGVQLWYSSAGEDWSSWSQPEFAAIHQLDRCRTMALDRSRVLVLDTTDAAGQTSTAIWAGAPAPAPGD